MVPQPVLIRKYSWFRVNNWLYPSSVFVTMKRPSMPRLINCVDMGSYMLLNDSRPDVCCQVVVVTLQCISTCVHGLLQRRRESSWAGRPLPAVAVFIAVSVA